MTFARLMHSACWLALMVLCFAAVALAQTETATISGLITDDTGAVVPGAEVKLQNVERGSGTSATTNNAGIYVFASVHPGQYQLTVHKPGFKQIDFLGLIVNVQDHVEQNFHLQVGSVAESVTVEASAATINTTDATVSTVVDRQFAENLPLNGRSFQTLIELTPGVVLTPSNSADNGQFSVNGQRAASNYWMVDGVSANIGANSGGSPGNGMGGTAGALSVLGGTNSLVSVDALQEFRIQTSTYAPEFGHTPGGQISIVTRSGTNQWHGTAFDYFRNDILDANNWFADHEGLSKPMERQNDFGGVLGGPIVKDRTFFFFSYEGLRLRLPQVTLTDVPCDSTCTVFGNARAMALPAMQPFLDAFPLPNGPEVFDTTANPTGAAEFNASYSNPASLDAYSIRIDHKFNDKLNLFGRYNYSPSEFTIRGAASGLDALSVIQPSEINIQTLTLGATWLIDSNVGNDLRFNYSRTDGSSQYQLDNFGGAVPLTSLPFPSPFTNKDAAFSLLILTLGNATGGAGGYINAGPAGRNLQRQINIVDSLSVQRGSHSLKFGVDFRRLSPVYAPAAYSQFPIFLDVPSAETGDSFAAFIDASHSVTLLFREFGAFAQDTWRVSSRLTLTYGLRWDVDFAPSALNGPSIPAVSGFNLTNLSGLSIAPPGTPPFKTNYGSVAPRLGIAYQINQSPNWGLVLRGGFGVFYDLVSSETGNVVGQGYPPFGSSNTVYGDTFPYSPAESAPLPIASTGVLGQLYAYNPNLKQPYTLQWNVALQQALSSNQSISATYVGATGRRLLQSFSIFNPPSNPIVAGFFIDNTATSDYDALQVQFQRRLSHGLQALVSYAWAHSIDDGSAGSFGVLSNAGIPGLTNVNRGPSDFDIRNTLSAALTYDVPVPKGSKLGNAVLHGWSVNNIVLARSAPPVDVEDNDFFSQFNGGITGDIRPDLVAGQPPYLYGAQYPGGKAFNPAAFTNPPSAPIGPDCPFGGCPARQGTTPRNFLRGFGATQWDFAVHREFPIHEALSLQFRAEMFNVLNHPNFGPPNAAFGTSSFGIANETLAQSLTGLGGAGSGALNPLYQFGGPRSIQFALKLQF